MIAPVTSSSPWEFKRRRAGCVSAFGDAGDAGDALQVAIRMAIAQGMNENGSGTAQPLPWKTPNLL